MRLYNLSQELESCLDDAVRLGNFKELIRRIEFYRTKTWKAFLATNPEWTDLLQCMTDVTPLRHDALRQLIARGASNDQLWFILVHIEPLRDNAAYQLLQQQPLEQELYLILRDCERFRDEAWQKLLAGGPSNNVLVEIIQSIRPLRGEAWKLLLKNGPTREDLEKLTDHRSGLRSDPIMTEAKQLLAQKLVAPLRITHKRVLAAANVP